MALGHIHNPATMANTLASTATLKREGWDACCGVHGHARARRGAKKGQSSARRKHDLEVVRAELREIE